MTQRITNQSINRNLLAPTQFYFSVERLPYVTFFGQSAVLPGISIPSVAVGTPFTKIQRTGDHIAWDPFIVTFKVDEDLRNWQEIFNWMIGIGFPEKFEQYSELLNNTGSSISPKGSPYSDGNILITNSNNVDTMRIEFQDIHPVKLSGLQFETTAQGVDYITATAEFEYTLYKVSRI